MPLLERAVACPRAAIRTGWTSVEDAGAGPLRDAYLAAQARMLWRQESIEYLATSIVRAGGPAVPGLAQQLPEILVQQQRTEVGIVRRCEAATHVHPPLKRTRTDSGALGEPADNLSQQRSRGGTPSSQRLCPLALCACRRLLGLCQPDPRPYSRFTTQGAY